MTTLRQLLLPGMSRSRLEHGGDIRRGKRKESRPFSSRKPMHLVFRSSRARGPWSLRRRANEKAIAEVLRRTALRFGIKIFEQAITGTHIHVLLRARRREDLQNFLRVAAGLIAERVTGAIKGQPTESGFWDETAYTRVVSWGSDFRNVAAYVRLNLLETQGLVPMRPRRHRRSADRSPAPSAVRLE